MGVKMKCSRCNGTGKFKVEGGDYQRGFITVECYECDGSGEV